jgi:hypothetical protein
MRQDRQGTVQTVADDFTDELQTDSTVFVLSGR